MNFPWFWFFFTSTCFVCNTNFCMLVDTGNIDISNSKTHLKASDFNIKTPFINSKYMNTCWVLKIPTSKELNHFPRMFIFAQFPVRVGWIRSITINLLPTLLNLSTFLFIFTHLTHSNIIPRPFQPNIKFQSHPLFWTHPHSYSYLHIWLIQT